MIIYRLIAPLTPGRPGLGSALAAMALTAVLGTTWQVPGEPLAAPHITAEPERNASPAAAGRSQQ
jgi:hypothetical protein